MITHNTNNWSGLILLLLFFLPIAPSFSQGSQVTFGKNRVQYHRDFDEWSQYESDNFITYWYGEGRNIGQAVVQFAEYDFHIIQGILEHRINDRIEIIVYTDLTDLKQSNIGSEETFNNIGGQTKIVGNKVFVYFDGDHTNLRKQVREGVASVYLNAMLFGSNLQEIVQNAVMMNLPEWFKQGLVSYVGEPWNTELDNELRDLILDKEFEGFNRLAEENPKLAGHSLWYYISETFGQSTVSNLLYLTRINRSVDSGFLYVLGSTYQNTTDSWTLFFKERYRKDQEGRERPAKRKVKFKNKRNLPITQLKISPDGKQIVYVMNEIGKYKIYLQDLRKGTRSVLLKEGFRNAFQATDYNYPLIAWNPNNMELAILYERRDVPKLMLYDLITKKEQTEDLSTQYQRVYSMEYTNPFTLVYSATVRGYSDLFLYFTKTRQTERITNDFYDDLDATVVKLGDQKGILFASNRKDSLLVPARLDTILPIDNFDIFFYNLTTKSSELVRVTNTPLADERKPVLVDSTHFAYLSDRSGIFNREAGYLEDYIHHYDQIIKLTEGDEIRMHVDSSLSSLDSTLIDTILIEPVIKKRAIVYPVSNYDRNILNQHTAPKVGKVVELVYRKGLYEIYQRSLDIDTIIAPVNTLFKKNNQRWLLSGANQGKEVNTPTAEPDGNRVLEEKKDQEIEQLDLSEEKIDTNKIDIDNYLFQSEFDNEVLPSTTIVIEEDEVEEEVIVIQEEIPSDPVNTSDLTTVGPIVQDLNSSLKAGIGSVVYRFRPGKIVSYRTKFRTDFVTTQLDNSLLFDGWDAYANNDIGFAYPPPGILLKGNFKDLFEDYEFEGGIRLPTTFNGTEYFLIFKDKKKRLDKEYAVYRKNIRYAQESRTIAPYRQEVNVLLGQYSLKYPLDIFRSIRATAKIRRDRLTQLATDLPTLNTPTDRVQRVGLKLEYVFDNTLDVALNIKNGTRYKIYSEFFKAFELNLLDGFTFDLNKGFLGVLGVDARHYERIAKHSVFAVRFAAASSFGTERILYIMGGVDNWLFPVYNENIPVAAPVDRRIAFRTLASNMRGFRINIRNGNSYALLNSELRVPVFKYFARRIRSSFFRNFQVVGFFDLGTAWEGLSPFSDDNPLNTTVIPNGDLVSVEVNYFRDPIVAGYGVGVRSVLFGYFLRVDYAWGIETRRVQDPRFFISLGMDF